MNIEFIFFFIIFLVLDYFIIKWQIKSNIDLFYALHQQEVIRVLNKYKKED